VITLIGENNSGKSNVLDALKAFGNKTFFPTDVPFHNLMDGAEPEICLFLKDHKENIKARVKLKGRKQYLDLFRDDKPLNPEPKKEFSQKSISLINYILAEETKAKFLANPQSGGAFKTLEPIITKLSRGELITDGEMVLLDQMIRNPNLVPIISEKFEQESKETFVSEAKKEFVPILASALESKNSKDISDLFNIKALPRIIEYFDQNKIKSADTMSPISSGVIQKPLFFQKLYDLLEEDSYEELKNAYLKFHESGMQRISILTNYSRKINKSIELLSKKYNEIYSFNGNNKYKFGLKLESNNIYFMISENEDDIFLDSQSTGFKWFFDFFFNVFADKKIEAGDIVILDEPATNLHVSGQIELRKQLKDFGMRSGITFVMSTHSPFLIDPDFLDEVRIIRKEGLETRIINKFTMDEKDLDVMMPIKTALTVNRHILLNPEDTLVFVEGVTDYNYLVMTKKFLNHENIVFMPIQGIKRPTLLKDLMKITKFPILLVDSDGAGKYVYEKYHSTPGIEIIRLSDIKEEFTEIEHLFSEVDQKKWQVWEKDYKITSAMKNGIIQNRITLSKETQANFKTLIERLEH